MNEGSSQGAVGHDTASHDGAVSPSALTAAAARAAHLVVDKEPRIFADTLAVSLLGGHAEQLLSYHRMHGSHPVLSGARTQVTCRSRYAEDRLAEAAARGVTQYIILGAGLDTFAYRPAAAGRAAGNGRLRVLEVDHPATQEWKRRALDAAGIAVPAGVTFVPADLAAGRRSAGGHGAGTRTAGTRTAEDRAGGDRAAGDPGEGLGRELAAAGADLTAPAFVSWLGVTMYLTPADVAATLAVIGTLAPGSEVVADYMLAPGLRDEAGAVYADLVATASADRGEPWLSFFEPGELTAIATAAGLGGVRHVRQRDAIPGALWRRADSLAPADLSVLLHATVPRG